MMSARTRRLAWGAAIVVFAGCASEEPGQDTPQPSLGGSAGQAGGSSGSGAIPSNGGAGVPDASFLDTATSDVVAEGCASVTEQATLTPLNLYVMLDKSSTMAGGKWQAARDGLDGFLKDPLSSGIRVAINFFPRPPDATPACDQKAYQAPRVPFAELPGNAAPILQAIDGEVPDGTSTPIYPALGGAILEGIKIRQNQPGDSAAVLLVTDGEPQGPAATCGGVDPEDPAVIAQLAATGAGFNPPVLTFVVGLPGVNQATANQIAAAGGTQAAIVVGTTNTQADFQKALATVRGKALPCEYEIPQKVAGGEIACNLVNMVFTHSPAEFDETIYKTDPPGDCAEGGWYYDVDCLQGTPSRIILCPSTCEKLKVDQGRMRIELGCETQVK